MGFDNIDKQFKQYKIKLECEKCNSTHQVSTYSLHNQYPQRIALCSDCATDAQQQKLIN